MFARDHRVSGGIVAMVVAALAAALVLGATVGSRDAEAAFPGTNDKIAFQSNRAGNNIHVMDANAATNDVVNLTNSDGNSEPAWSPDGSRIAFVSGGSSRGYDIFVMNADGSGRRQVTDTGLDAPGTPDDEPAWSPDGTRIAYVRNNIDIWVINADGSGTPTKLTNDSTADTDPVWSPDGTKIAFERSQDIYLMDTDPATNDAFSLTPNSPAGCSPTCYQGHDNDPAWSPDGTKIAYVHGFGPPTNPYAGGGLPNIWTMDPNGNNKVNVQYDENTSGSQPAWSPDGTQIAFVGVANLSTNRNIYVMDADGTNETPLDTSSAHDISPDWQPTPQCTNTNATPGDDTITGDPAKKEVICGAGGNDTITGQDGDILMGDAGNDKLMVPTGRATLNGGADNDAVSFENAGKVSASLTSGFAQRVGTSPLEGVALVDVENLMGSPLADMLTGSNAANKLLGLGGKDRINSHDGRKNDTVNGNAGTDRCATDKNEISIKSC